MAGCKVANTMPHTMTISTATHHHDHLAAMPWGGPASGGANTMPHTMTISTATHHHAVGGAGRQAAAEEEEGEGGGGAGNSEGRGISVENRGW